MSESQKTSLVVPKTPDQLRNQFKWTAAGDTTSRGKLLPERYDRDLSLTTINREDLRKRLDEEQEIAAQYPEEVRPHATPLANSYERYVDQLRLQRKQESLRIREYTSKVPEGESKVQALREATAYSSQAAYSLLDSMQSSPGKLKRFFTDEEMHTAAQTYEGFETMLNFLVDNSNNQFDDIIHKLTPFLSENRLINVLNRIAEKQPSTIAIYIGGFSPYLTPEARKEILLYALSKETTNIETFYSRMSGDEIVEIFSEQEYGEIMRQIWNSLDGRELPSIHTTRLLIDKGILTKEEVADFVLSGLEKNLDNPRYTFFRLEDYLEYLSDSQTEQAIETLRNHFTNPNSKISLMDIDNLRMVFSREEKKVLMGIAVRANPSILGRSLSVAKEYFTPEEFAEMLREQINSKGEHIYGNTTLIKELFENQELAIDHKRQFLEDLSAHSPKVLLMCFREASAVITGDAKSYLKNLLEKVGPDIQLTYLKNWIEFFSNDPQEQKDYVRDLILQKNDYSFVAIYLRYDSEKLRTLFTQDEIKDLLYKQAELGVGDLFYELSEVRQVLQSDSEFKRFIDRVIQKDPVVLLQHLDQIAYLYNQPEIQEIVTNLARDERGVVACIGTIKNWGDFASVAFASEFLRQHAHLQPEEVIYNFEDCLKYVPDNQKEEFVDRIIKQNPPLSLRYFGRVQRNHTTLTPEEIVKIGQNDSEKIRYAPRSLAEFYQDISKITDQAARRALLKNAQDLYNYIIDIEAQGLADDLRAVQENSTVTKAQEAGLLSIYKCFAVLKQKYPEDFSKIENLGTSIEESGNILVQMLANRAGIDREITQEEARTFIVSMGSPAPFAIYYLQYESSEAHKPLLDGMLKSLVEGDFRNWKFGNDTDEGFAAIKKEGLIPQNTTIDQYRIWREDQDLTMFESLQADADYVTEQIRTLIKDNLHDIGVDINLDEKPAHEHFKDVEQELASVGQELARINSELGPLLKNPNGDKERISFLTVYRAQALEERSRLAKARDVLRIYEIQPDEVSADYFLNESDRSKRVARISDVLEGLRKKTEPNAHFVYDRIEGFIANFHEQTTEKQNLVCTDSSDPRVAIEIGDNPVGSCQHFAHGEYNQSLIAYPADPNTKFLVIRNEKGNLVSRSAFRLLSNPNEDPELHIERIYSSVSSPAIQKIIYTHALRKAESMGIKLHVSTEAQNAQGVETGVYVPDNFSTKSVSEGLHSNGSRAPYVYVDSAGGQNSFGKYTIGKIREVQNA